MAAERLFQIPALRYSIGQLILATALVGLACVALRNAGPVWVAALLGGVLALLGAGLPLALFREGQQRSFWIGFALFGWLYLLVLAYGWSLDANTSSGNPLRPQALITAHLSMLGYNKLYPASRQTADVVYDVNGTLVLTQGSPNQPVIWDTRTGNALSGFSFSVGRAGTSAPPGPTREDFVNVAHACWALLIAVCGGWFSCWVFATRRPRTGT